MRDTDVESGRESAPGIPRWVKVFGIIVLVLILLVVAVMLIGGGGHGPGRHAPSGDTGSRTLPSSGRQNTRSGGGPADVNEAARLVKDTTLEAMTFERGRMEVQQP